MYEIDLTKPIKDFGFDFKYDVDEKYLLSLKLVFRFFNKIEITQCCWLWKACIHKENGYGVFSINGNSRQAHIISYISLINNYDDNLVIDHLCRTRNCVNPFHLEPVTDKENSLRGIGYCAKAAKKTHCPKGHEYTEENTWRRLKKDGMRRECLACHRERKLVKNLSPEQRQKQKERNKLLWQKQKNSCLA